jgi:uncharacterized protein
MRNIPFQHCAFWFAAALLTATPAVFSASDAAARFSASSAYERSLAATRYSSALQEASKSSSSSSAARQSAPTFSPASGNNTDASPPPPLEKSTFEKFTDRAETGDIEAIRALAAAYAIGVGDVPKDLAKSLQLWALAADRGDLFSQGYWGARLMFGDGIARNTSKGLQYLQSAYAKGSGDAAAYLGEAKEKGLIASAGESEVQALYKEAAQKGSAQGAMRYANQALASRDRALIQDGARYAKFAADKNLPEGWVEYGRYLEDGIGGVAKNQSAACSLYEKASNSGSLRGFGNLAGCFVASMGGRSDILRGLAMWEQLVDKGYTEPSMNLAFAYRGGLSPLEGKTPIDVVKSRKYASICAARGDSDCQAILAFDLFNGRGGPIDAVAAVKWALSAATTAHPLALGTLGSAYYNGKGVEKNLVTSEQYYKRGAESGDSFSQKEYAWFLLEPQRDQISKDLGVKYLKASALQGDTLAQVDYGMIVSQGAFGQPIDIENGLKMLNAVAARISEIALTTKLNDYDRSTLSAAYFWIGTIYGLGPDQYRDKSRSLEFLNKASVGGNERAAATISKVQAQR